MNLDHCTLFRDIVQTRSLSRGAALSGISQSAASQHVRELESRFGVMLLDRSTRPFTLTPAGKLYHDFCRDLLRREDDFKLELESLKTEVEGTVRVASIYSVGLSEMTYVKHVYTARYPNARLEVEFLRPDKIYEAVREDRADFGFVSYPREDRILAAIPWREEEMVVAAAPSHPLARRSETAAPADLDGLAFVAFDEGLPIRQHIDRFLREHGVTVDVAMHFDNIQMVKEAVALGASVSILPAPAMQAEVEQGRLAAIPLAAELRRPIGILHRRRKKFHRAAQKFLDLLALTPVAH